MKGSRIALTMLVAAGALGLVSCQPARGPASGELAADLVVVAPHPDDEILLAGGILMAARARGVHVAVIVVTNGDFTCERDGHVRQAESVRALALLGVPEGDVHFLGYPDGWLTDLGDAPLPPIERRSVDGTCGKASGTYAERGASGMDEHRARTGGPAPYDARSLEADLAALFQRLRPHDVYVTHPLDSHPDHAATYAYVRRALDRVGARPRLHRGVVHGGPCWPNGSGAEPCPAIDHAHDFASPVPALPDPYRRYVPEERVVVADPARKLSAILAYVSQLGADPDHDWLTSFARSEEVFWPEDVGQAPAPAESAGSVTLSPGAPGGEVAAYRLELDADGGSLTLTRAGARLRKWSLPLDGRERAHRFDVRAAAHREGGGEEIAVRRDGAWLGVAIDVP